MTGPELLLNLPGSPVGSLEEARAFEKTALASSTNVESSYEALVRAANALPDKIALRFLPTGALSEPVQDFTYREVLAKVSATARYFQALGVGSSDAVLILAPPYPDTYFALFGAQACGISATANPMLSVEHLAGIAEAAKAKVVVACGPDVNAEIWEKAVALKAAVSSLETIVTVAGAPSPEGADLSHEIEGVSSERLPLGGLNRGHDTAAYFHTGGTTGAPKLAKLTHLNQLYGAWSNAAMLDFDLDHVTPNGLPLFHVGGAVVIAFRSFFLGQTLVQMTPLGYRSPEVSSNLWQLAEDHGFTQLIGVPTNFIDWYATRPTSGETSVRYFSVGATKPLVELLHRYKTAFGKSLHEGYGMTEFSGWCTAHPMKADAIPGNSGFAVPYCDLRIFHLDEDGRFAGECATGEIGTIAVSGPCVFAGYVNDKDNREKFIDGGPDGKKWMNTGDLGSLDAAGYLQVTGREKDLIIRGGHNIDPALIEDILVAQSSVSEAAAVGMPDNRVGERPIAFVTCEPGESFNEASLLEVCRQDIPERAAVPSRIICIDEMPRTVMGKIFKPTLRDLAAELAVAQLLEQALPQDYSYFVQTVREPGKPVVTSIHVSPVPGVSPDEISENVSRLLENLPIEHRVEMG